MRHQEFDTKQVLGKAMHVFWQKGYKGASMQELLGEMGIGKGSFYATFGSKRDLFVEALKHFGETKAMLRETKHLLANEPAKVAIAQILHRVIDRSVNTKRACLFGKTAFEFWGSDPDVAEEVSGGLKRVEEGFYSALLRGQELGEIPKDRDAKALAKYLTSIFYGLQVMASANPDRKNLETVASTALTVLDN